METLFENSYIKNREWAKDVFGYINFRRPLIIVFDVYFFLCIVLGIVDIIVEKNLQEIDFGIYEGYIYKEDTYNVPDPEFINFFLVS